MQLSFALVTDSTHLTFQFKPPTSEETSTSAGPVPLKGSPSSAPQRPVAERRRFSITIVQHPHPRGIRQAIRKTYNQIVRMFSNQQEESQALSPQELPGQFIPHEIQGSQPLLELDGDIPNYGMPMPPMPPMPCITPVREGRRLQQHHEQVNRHQIGDFDHGRQWSPREPQRPTPSDWLPASPHYPFMEGRRRVRDTSQAALEASHSLPANETPATPVFAPSHDQLNRGYQQNSSYPIQTGQYGNAQAFNSSTNSPSYHNRYVGGDDPKLAVSPVSTSDNSAHNYPTPPTASPTSRTSMSPKNPVAHGFQSSHSFPSQTIFSQPGLIAIPTQNPYGTSRLDSIPEQTSHWARRKPEDCVDKLAAIAPPSRHNSISSFDNEEPPPLYHPGPANIEIGSAKSAHPMEGELDIATAGGHDRIPLPVKGFRKLLSMFCGRCNIEFTGEYCKGNLERHNRNRHYLVVDSDVSRKCRYCPSVYRRSDAKRKHEWEKHKAPDCRPVQRRVEKTQKGKVVVDNQKRIYMPNVDCYQLVTDW